MYEAHTAEGPIAFATTLNFSAVSKATLSRCILLLVFVLRNIRRLLKNPGLPLLSIPRTPRLWQSFGFWVSCRYGDSLGILWGHGDIIMGFPFSWETLLWCMWSPGQAIFRVEIAATIPSFDWRNFDRMASLFQKNFLWLTEMQLGMMHYASGSLSFLLKYWS